MSKFKNRYRVINGIPTILPVRARADDTVVLDAARRKAVEEFTPEMLALEKMLADRRERLRSEYQVHSDLSWK